MDFSLSQLVLGLLNIVLSAIIALLVFVLINSGRWRVGHWPLSPTVLVVALATLLVIGALAFVTIGIDAGDLRNGKGFSERTQYPALPFADTGGLQFVWSLDWKAAPSFAELRSRLFVPGQVGVCVTDADAGDRHCVEVCRGGVFIDKSRWHVDRISLPSDCTAPASDQAWIRRITLA